MRKLALLLVLLSPLAALGQGIIAVSPRQCVWRAGDNPAWAAPNLDESGWQPRAQTGDAIPPSRESGRVAMRTCPGCATRRIRPFRRASTPLIKRT